MIDRAPQLVPDKTRFELVRVDPAREIAANKVCALLDRVEARDLFDLQRLMASGLRLEDLLRDAQQKHAGADAATLAWVLGGWSIPPTAAVPEETSAQELDAFRETVVRELARLALPSD